jgi:hypothetical protein
MAIVDFLALAAFRLDPANQPEHVLMISPNSVDRLFLSLRHPATPSENHSDALRWPVFR